MLFSSKLAAAASASALLLLTAAPAASPPAQQGSLPESWIEHLDWRNVGPANMGGRCTSIAVNPDDPAEYWVGTATGGVLHTTNRGVTYEHQFDSESTSSVGSIAVAASNSDVVWVGSGESNPRNSVSWGHGVFKSTDGGKTWKNMGLKDTFHIGVVKVHPENENVVYVGALGRLWGDCENRGLYKTADGGETWEKVLFVDEKTGIIDMRLDPQNPDTIIIATYERQRDGFDTNDPAKKWGAGSGLHKSTDGGKTWKELRSGLPSGTLGRIGLDYSASEPGVVWAVVESDRITQEPENAAWMGLRGEDAEVGARVTSVEEDGPADEAGLQEGDIVILMAGQTVHSWSDLQDRIREQLAGKTVGVVVSRDRERVEMDVTFRKRPSEEEDREGEEEGDVEEEEKDAPPEPGPFHLGLGGQVANVQDQQGPDGHEYGGIYRSADGGETWVRINSLNPRPMYYSRIYVDPSDGEKIYVLGTQLHKSMDGGKTFTPDGHDREVHVDHHAMWINPADGRNMILGNDGGIYVTFDRMSEWDHHNYMALGQFYQVEADATRDYKVYGGLQDNGSWGGPNRVANNDGPVNSDWFNVGGGDGFVIRVDPSDPNQIYGESQNGWTYRVNLETGAQSSIRARPPRGERYRFNWNTPFILSPHNSQIYYNAGNHVFRSPNKGNGLTPISPEITLTDRGSATALHESPVREGVIYVGTDDGALWMTPDHGETWIDLYNPPAKEPEDEADDQEASSDTEVSPAEPGKDPASPLDGKWSGQAEHEEIPEGQGGFTMNLNIDEQGRIRGSMTTDFGDSTLSDGKFDAENSSLRFRFSNDMMSGIVTGKLDGNSMIGEIDAGPGMIVLDFEAKREGAKTAADPAPSEAPQARNSQGRGGGARDSGQGRRGQGRGQFRGPDLENLPPEVQERIRQRRAESGGGTGDRGGRMRQQATPNTDDLKGLAEHMGEHRFHVSAIAASEHNAERVYITLDGHRSDNDLPHVFRSDDMGRTWTSLQSNLPDSAGSARVIVEDYENPDVLFLGTEFGAWASIDRGASWTRINNDDLPTVPVHDFKLHRLTGELVAGTHGRSIWIVDVSTLRQLSADAMAESAMLYQPEEAMIWNRSRQAGSSGTRRFVGENPATGAAIRYSLGSRTRSVQLWITDIRGETIWEAEDAPASQGLHEFRWNLRGATSGGRRWSPPVAAGQYLVNLKVDGNTQTKVLDVLAED
ncbi:MAG: PDZ domain-containing protein [Planctomycetes bacterium]|nr:PDZ domain-containing protein [Planctomycetota bacterium]